MNFQTRSEETGLAHYDTLEQAIIASINDPSIWKISFVLSTNETVILIWTNCGWSLQSGYIGTKQG